MGVDVRHRYGKRFIDILLMNEIKRLANKNKAVKK
jgi:hypothetical protein